MLRLGRALLKVETIEQADAWLGALNAWYASFGHLTELKTHVSDKGAVRTNEVRASTDWWWTHLRLRRGYRLLRRLAREGHLFTFLAPELASLDLNRTTNRIEGGINAPPEGPPTSSPRHDQRPPTTSHRMVVLPPVAIPGRTNLPDPPRTLATTHEQDPHHR